MELFLLSGMLLVIFKYKPFGGLIMPDLVGLEVHGQYPASSCISGIFTIWLFMNSFRMTCVVLSTFYWLRISACPPVPSPRAALVCECRASCVTLGARVTGCLPCSVTFLLQPFLPRGDGTQAFWKKLLYYWMTPFTGESNSRLWEGCVRHQFRIWCWYFLIRAVGGQRHPSLCQE